ncbi:MAG: type ISP restriction/modification enzyme [Baekduia sp.]
MSALSRYMRAVARIHKSGEASEETSYYPAVAALLNEIGGSLSPSVHCVLTPKNRGAGIPDGALFIERPGGDDRDMSVDRVPERGVVEVKGLSHDVQRVARSSQVRRYLKRYGTVLVTNYRQFVVVHGHTDGSISANDEFTLAESEHDFWRLVSKPAELEGKAEAFELFLARVLEADAPLASPQDLAALLAAYARVARARIDEAGNFPSLATLQSALEQALGLRFDAKRGREFFHSALVQTLFYGLFSAWVVWTERPDRRAGDRFSWRAAQWTLNVPMVRVLFEQVATRSNLPAGVDEVLDWTEDAFARVDETPFFERLARREAVQYFYEPFLEAYDPDLRRQLGVWYTPPEIVRYMVARVNEALINDLGVPLGLADERVHVLDPCTGTGSFLVEVLRTIQSTLLDLHNDDLVAQQVKEAARTRVHGFEVLPAPFIVSHLQVGLALAEMGGALDANEEERASVYLTNALSGWVGGDDSVLPFEAFRKEREAAGNVKRTEPILVVLGNPPYNGFAGIAADDEGDLIEAYKEGLSDEPWGVTKNKLDDYYIRFFRIAERRIAEQTGCGIVCFISNFGWLGDPSAVIMRKRLLAQFDRVFIDNLNGDSRETGKKTPMGENDPSAFATAMNPRGIQVGTAVSLLVRSPNHATTPARVMYRDFWGPGKRLRLEASVESGHAEDVFELLSPDKHNWFRLRRWAPRKGYEFWPSVVELADERPRLGLNENRDEGLIDVDRERLADRMGHFLDPDRAFEDLEPDRVGKLLQPWARYDARRVRDRLLSTSPYDSSKIAHLQVKPFDVRFAYVDDAAKLWNEVRPEYLASAVVRSESLLVRKRAPRALDGASVLLSPHLCDQHVLHKDAYAIPLLRPVPRDEGPPRLFALDPAPLDAQWRPNLSGFAFDYLTRLGLGDAETSRWTARMIWLHVLAVSFSPLYLDENGDAIRNDWPRVPLPDTRQSLEASASLGAQIAALLDIDAPLPGLDVSVAPHLRAVAAWSTGATKGVTGDWAVTAGWGIRQVRLQKSGAVSHLVMPGEGKTCRRARTDEERDPLSVQDIALLGDEVIDVYLNDEMCWKGIPEAAWNMKIGGFQVLRKWLSYREAPILGRSLTLGEVRQFRSIARRVTALSLLTPQFDANYRVAAGVVDQEPFPQLVTDQGA